jgi:hypothetical protein
MTGISAFLVPTASDRQWATAMPDSVFLATSSAFSQQLYIYSGVLPLYLKVLLLKDFHPTLATNK